VIKSKPLYTHIRDLVLFGATVSTAEGESLSIEFSWLMKIAGYYMGRIMVIIRTDTT
jgi:hypothetical protein